MIEHHQVDYKPGWVIFMHKLARNGKASKVMPASGAGTICLVKFDPSTTVLDKFKELEDAEVIYLYYSPRSQQ
jgi:hypothetical protein